MYSRYEEIENWVGIVAAWHVICIMNGKIEMSCL